MYVLCPKCRRNYHLQLQRGTDLEQWLQGKSLDPETGVPLLDCYFCWRNASPEWSAGVPRRMEISSAAAKTIAALLRLCADELNHPGCHDFSLRRRAGLTDAEAVEILCNLKSWSLPDDSQAAPYTPDTDIVTDWMLMSMFADKLDPKGG